MHVALDVLRAALDAEGIDASRPDLDAVVRAVRAFARQPVEVAWPDDDALLFEAGTYDPPISPVARRAFTLSFTRQLCASGDGEEVGMEHVRCDLAYEPAPDLDAVRATVWSVDFDGLDAFFAHVEASPAVQAARRHRPFGFVVDQYAV